MEPALVLMSGEAGMMIDVQERCSQLLKYAQRNELINLQIALTRMRDMVHERKLSEAEFFHALSVVRILVDLTLPVSEEEEDAILTAALCHILAEDPERRRDGEAMVVRSLRNPGIFHLVLSVTEDPGTTEARQAEFYAQLRRNTQAALVKLADRSTHVENLFDLPVWRARAFIQETRTHYFPLCVFMKEHAPEFTPVVSILLEKMRYLLDMTDILSSRYEAKELAILQEIEELSEENARLRTLIARLDEEE